MPQYDTHKIFQARRLVREQFLDRDLNLISRGVRLTSDLQKFLGVQVNLYDCRPDLALWPHVDIPPPSSFETMPIQLVLNRNSVLMLSNPIEVTGFDYGEGCEDMCKLVFGLFGFFFSDGAGKCYSKKEHDIFAIKCVQKVLYCSKNIFGLNIKELGSDTHAALKFLHDSSGHMLSLMSYMIDTDTVLHHWPTAKYSDDINAIGVEILNKKQNKKLNEIFEECHRKKMKNAHIFSPDFCASIVYVGDIAAKLNTAEMYSTYQLRISTL